MTDLDRAAARLLRAWAAVSAEAEEIVREKELGGPRAASTAGDQEVAVRGDEPRE